MKKVKTNANNDIEQKDMSQDACSYVDFTEAHVDPNVLTSRNEIPDDYQQPIQDAEAQANLRMAIEGIKEEVEWKPGLVSLREIDNEIDEYRPIWIGDSTVNQHVNIYASLVGACLERVVDGSSVYLSATYTVILETELIKADLSYWVYKRITLGEEDCLYSKGQFLLQYTQDEELRNAFNKDIGKEVDK